jgi:hypothetical protein
MNIFVLSTNPKLAAKYHCDKHVVKMILESAQMLCTAHHVCPNMQTPAYFYKKTHINHPCNIWVRKSLENYTWLGLLASSLLNEFEKRYNKPHKAKDLIAWLCANKPDLQSCGLTQFAQTMPEQYKAKSSIKAYRNYYIGEKYKIIKYKTGEVPYFLKELFSKE